jgi:DNA-directed RNA polymerase I, II, and III subunit RPABC5
MLIPVRCFTCYKVIGNKWDLYNSLLKKGYSEADALDAIGFTRFCCRRMFISHVDIIDDLLKY